VENHKLDLISRMAEVKSRADGAHFLAAGGLEKGGFDQYLDATVALPRY